MPRMPLRVALEEVHERQGDFCQCGAVPDPEWEPHCFLCGSYWKDVEDGLFDFDEACET